jgi:enoyl-CoA hydratase
VSLASSAPLSTGPTVTQVRHDAVALLTISRPEKANAMDGDAPLELLQAIRAIAADETARALVITGEGDTFSAGGDLETIRQMGADAGVRDAVLQVHRDLFWEMLRLPIPSVSAVNGPAVGAGLTVALLSDLVVMADDAFLSDPRVSLGLLDGAGGLILWPLLTSLSAAKEHLLLGDRVSAAEAHRIGLVNRVVTRPQVLPESLDLGRRLAKLPAAAVQRTRRLLNAQLESFAADLLDECSTAESECFDTPEHLAQLQKLTQRQQEKSASRSSP